MATNANSDKSVQALKSDLIKFEDLEIPALTEVAKESFEEALWATEKALTKQLEFGRVLLIVKAKLPHGEWGSWVRETFQDQFSLRTIQTHMKAYDSIAQNPALLECANSLDDILKLTTKPRKASVEVIEMAADEPRDIAPEVAAESEVSREQTIYVGEHTKAKDPVIDPDRWMTRLRDEIEKLVPITVEYAASSCDWVIPWHVYSKMKLAQVSVAKLAITRWIKSGVLSVTDGVIVSIRPRNPEVDQDDEETFEHQEYQHLEKLKKFAAKYMDAMPDNQACDLIIRRLERFDSCQMRRLKKHIRLAKQQEQTGGES
jgi:hypothetical protein